MTDREKLGKLLAESASIAAYKRGDEWEYSLNIEEIIDHLIAHGVKVKELQKPIAIEELKILGVYWLEERGDKLMPCEIGRFSGAHYTEINIIGWAIPDELKNYEYGKTWRCWAEKPTEEERKAAEWEE